MKNITFQVEDDVDIIILSTRDRSGKIANMINAGEFKHEFERGGKPPDSYMGFIAKTLIDDFSSVFKTEKISDEQIEASVMETLKLLLGTNTRGIIEKDE